MFVARPEFTVPIFAVESGSSRPSFIFDTASANTSIAETPFSGAMPACAATPSISILHAVGAGRAVDDAVHLLAVQHERVLGLDLRQVHVVRAQKADFLGHVEHHFDRPVRHTRLVHAAQHFHDRRHAGFVI